ncbi:hypothetical protein G6F37_010478 [Rhizopus arrhizus]|nr:hypothetical protein G6F38_012036 [Rhizopus arrhizus]KAG1153303.1 hypothetical protein G6F37_010478 [Rhizopus arrhizus]
MNQDFLNGPEFYENTATGEELDESESLILEENQRINQEARGNDVEILYSTENNKPHPSNLYYTDEEEMMRYAREDLNQMDDQERRTDRDDNVSSLLIDPSHSDGMYFEIFYVKQKAKSDDLSTC